MISRNPQKYGGWLLASLLALQVGGPVLNQLLPTAQRVSMLVLYLAVLATATATLSKHRLSLRIAIALALPALLIGVASVLDSVTPFLGLGPRETGLLVGASAIPLQVYAGYSTLVFVLHTGLITKYRLMGTATVFLLLAHAWAGAYAIVELIAPGSFACQTAREISLDELMYFSLVTQTTLGFGDVTPISNIARALVTFQAVAGLFYMGVIVARLAGHMDLDEVTREDDHDEACG